MNARHLPLAGGFGRAAPPRSRTRTHWALLAFAIFALAIEGCSSFGLNRGCSTCGVGGSVRRLGQRVFNRTPGCAECDSGFIGGAPVIDVAPPPMLTTPPAVVPGELAPAVSPLPPSADEAPLDLRPLPSDETAPTTSSRSLRRGGAGVQTAGRDALSRTSGQGQEVASVAASDPLARFEARLEPPLTQAPAAEPEPSAQPAPAPPPDETPPQSLPIEPPVASPTEEALDASSTHSIPATLEVPPASLDGSGSIAPGFARFENLEPKLSGGSLPSDSGWSWLVEQGYRTVLDLRPMDQIRQQEVARVNATGLRYLALPVDDEAIDDPSTITLFASLVGADPSRPLYFFDTDGSRSAVLWYLHKVTNLHAAPQDALLQADAIGPRVPALWDRARAYVEHTQPAPASTSSAVSAPEPPEFPVPDRDPEPRSTSRAASAAIGQNDQASVGPAEPPASSAPLVPTLPPPTPEDPGRWRPYVTLAVSGLTVPLFFLGRSAVSHAVRPRASRSGSEREPKALQDASGA